MIKKALIAAGCLAAAGALWAGSMDRMVADHTVKTQENSMMLVTILPGTDANGIHDQADQAAKEHRQGAAQLYVQMGEQYQAAGQIEQAVVYYRLALQTDAGCREAIQALNKLGEKLAGYEGPGSEVVSTN